MMQNCISLYNYDRVHILNMKNKGHVIINYLFQYASSLTHVPCRDWPNLPPLVQGVHLAINPSASGSSTAHSDGQLLIQKQKNKDKTS